MIHTSSSEVRVVGLPQCGMFMDQPDYTGKPSYTPLYANMFNLMGAWVWKMASIAVTIAGVAEVASVSCENMRV